MQNLVTVSHTVCMHVKGLKKSLECCYPVPLRQNTWLNPKNMHVLHLSYHDELGRCRSNRMGVSIGSKNWRCSTPAPLGWVSDLLETCRSPCVLPYHGKCGRSRGSKKWGEALGHCSLMMGACLTHGNKPFPTGVITPNLVVIGQTI